MTTQMIIDLFIPMSLFTIMFGMGLGLVVDDFRRVLSEPRAVALGVFAQLIALPAVGFALAMFASMEAELAVGMVLLASCPGGPSSNLFAHLARGDTALSVTLTAISGTVTIVTLPLIVGAAVNVFLGGDDGVELPVLRTVGELMMVVLVPVTLGMVVRAYRPVRAARLERVLTRVAVALLMILVAGAVIKERGQIPGFIVQAGPIVLVLNLSTMALGWMLGRVLGLSTRQVITLTLEVGIQNAGMAIFIAVTLLGRTSIAIPAVIYGLWMYVSCAAVVAVARRVVPA